MLHAFIITRDQFTKNQLEKSTAQAIVQITSAGSMVVHPETGDVSFAGGRSLNMFANTIAEAEAKVKEIATLPTTAGLARFISAKPFKKAGKDSFVSTVGTNVGKSLYFAINVKGDIDVDVDALDVAKCQAFAITRPAVTISEPATV